MRVGEEGKEGSRKGGNEKREKEREGKNDWEQKKNEKKRWEVRKEEEEGREWRVRPRAATSPPGEMNDFLPLDTGP